MPAMNNSNSKRRRATHLLWCLLIAMLLLTPVSASKAKWISNAASFAAGGVGGT